MRFGILRSTLVSLVLGVALSGAAHAQEPASKRPSDSRFAIQGNLGFSNFLDDYGLYHYVAGGNARIRIFRGLTFVPEFTYMYRSRADRDFLLLPNVAWEFRRGKRIVPYVIGGVGMLNHRANTDYWDSNITGAISGGGFGAKLFLNQRVFIAPEFRIGWEPHYRFTMGVGYVLAR